MKMLVEKLLFLCVCGGVLVLCGCGEKRAHIAGAISAADGKTLYLDAMTLGGAETLDSCVLDDEGNFSFALAAQEAPEFYRLRIDGQTVHLCVDSTETITVSGALPTLSRDYRVEGSDDCEQLRLLSLRQQQLQARVEQLRRDPRLTWRAASDSMEAVVAAYKDDVRSNIIYAAPNRAYAYFALFQTLSLGGSSVLLFNPRDNDDDLKAYAAVGTCWDTYHHGARRTENLHNIVIESMKTQRIVAAQQSQTISADRIDTSGIVDIALRDNNGVPRRLSDLKGKVVLLDFCLFAADGTTQRTMALRDVWNKYHTQGFDIFQVSLDSDEHFWKTQTAALPWVSVRDGDGAQSVSLTRYNVAALPTFFLLDRSCCPVLRDVQIEDLNTSIEALLHQ